MTCHDFSFDTPAELDSGTMDVFENVLSPSPTTSTQPSKTNDATSLSAADLAKYWSTLGNLLTVGMDLHARHHITWDMRVVMSCHVQSCHVQSCHDMCSHVVYLIACTLSMALIC